MKENQLKRYSVQTENKENGKQIKVYGHWRDYLKLNKSVEYPPPPPPSPPYAVDNKDGEVIENDLGLERSFHLFFLGLSRVIPARCMSLIFTLFFIITRAKIIKSTLLSMRNHII